ncbi:MAG: FkbM family methyltransferase [Pseudomonadota bacterium]
MSVTARAEGSGVPDGSLYREARQALRSLCPQPLLNWREARFYARYGEVELHVLEFLCRRDQDAIDVGANDGSYVHHLRRHARRVIAFEPMPNLADALVRKFTPRPGTGIVVRPIALSDRAGTVELHMPVVDGVTVTGCATVSATASATYPKYRAIKVPIARLDDEYDGDVGFIKIDVEGHEQAVLDGAIETIRRCRPRLLVEIDERLSPRGLARARGFFRPLGYQGFFIHAGTIKPMASFAPQTMQNGRDLPDLTAPLQQRERFGRYIYNFIFLPKEEPSATLRRMAERLSRL